MPVNRSRHLNRRVLAFSGCARFALAGLLLLMLPLTGALAQPTAVDFEGEINGATQANHTGFSSGGVVTGKGADGFRYGVNSGGSLKYVTGPAALYIGYLRATPTSTFIIANSLGSFVPDTITFSNPFYLSGALQIKLNGFQNGANVWSPTVTVGTETLWENIELDIRALAPPAMERLEITPVAPAGDLYGYFEGWSYVLADDADGDGVFDGYDQCAGTLGAETANSDGCADSQLDDDDDGVFNPNDQCPGTPVGAAVNANGCAQSQLDGDGDGINNGLDACPGTAPGQLTNAEGCSVSQLDANGNGIEDRVEAALLLIILNSGNLEEK